MTIRSLGYGLALLLAGLVPNARAGGVEALPDLVPDVLLPAPPAPIIQRGATVDPADVAEGCAASTTNRTLVHFALTTVNAGPVDMVLGDPGCPDCKLFPGPTCTNPLFECSPLAGHGHPHFTKYAIYELLASPEASAAATGHKESFCIEDTICDNRVYDCYNQGLSVGCTDLYPPFALGCQYVDATDLPGGRYVLRATVNYEHLLPESNYDNNVAQKIVEVCEGIDGPKVRLRTKKKEPGIVYWSLKGHTFTQPPLVSPDAFADGAIAHLEFDGAKLVNVVVPGPGAGYCGPKDGWKKDPKTGVATYKNESGFIDSECSVSANGLQRLRVAMRPVTRDGVARARIKYSALGRTEAPTPVTRVRATTGIGAELGPCWTGAASCDAKGHCTPASAEGAFVN